MFRLSQFYDTILNKPLPTDCGISCEVVDQHMAKLNRLLTESVSCFSYTLVLSGTSVVSYNDRIETLVPNDIFIYTPGMMIQTLEASENFNALCLIGDEAKTYEIPYSRNVISASYFPFVFQSGNKLSLSPKETACLENRMNEIRRYTDSEHIYKEECIYSTYALFILDLLDIESRMKKDADFSGHTVDLFLKFLKLLSENYITRHDITFYAEKLCVTTIYLSRIVKRFSGQTVKNHVNRLLIMEASYLLLNTDHPISTIAEKLHFATPASFCKFFSRHKEISPREYRISGPLNP